MLGLPTHPSADLERVSRRNGNGRGVSMKHATIKITKINREKKKKMKKKRKKEETRDGKRGPCNRYPPGMKTRGRRVRGGNAGNGLSREFVSRILGRAMRALRIGRAISRSANAPNFGAAATQTIVLLI